MLVSVAICTFNRAESLRRTLDSLARMRLPKDLDWEVVVVNNDCSDNTDEVIENFSSRLPIRREFEPQRGLSRARNRAVDYAKGDYIVWTDDDVMVDPGWLAAYVEAFRRWPEAGVFGGPIKPRYMPPVPKWVSESAELLGTWVFSGRDFGDGCFRLSVEDCVPYGPNFAMRAYEQRTFRYNPELGHAPGQRRRGEELDVIARVLRSGVPGYWVAQARVEHCASAEQQTIRYVASVFASIGESEAFRRGTSVPTGPLCLGVPRWLWRRVIGSWLRYRINRLFSRPSIWLPPLRDYALAWGAIRYWRRRAK